MLLRISSISALVILIMGCNPTVRVEAPSEPIRIELTATIKHEIRIIVQKDVEKIFEEDDLF